MQQFRLLILHQNLFTSVSFLILNSLCTYIQNKYNNYIIYRKKPNNNKQTKMQKTSSLKAKQQLSSTKGKSKQLSELSQKLFDTINTVDSDRNTGLGSNCITGINFYSNHNSSINNNGSTISNSRIHSVANNSSMKFQRNSAYGKIGSSGRDRQWETHDFNKKIVSNQNNNVNDQEDFVALGNEQDPIFRLIQKAKCITTENQGKLQKAKKQLRTQKQRNGTFLTGTGIYQVQTQPNVVQQQDPDIDPTSLLKQLIDKQKDDDLAELRRMIKKTDRNLNSYGKQVYQTSQDVIHAADHFNKQLDFGIRCKINGIKQYDEGHEGGSQTSNSYNSNNVNKNEKKKMASNGRIKDPKYF